MSVYKNEPASKNGAAAKFEQRQSKYADNARGLLTPGLNPGISDEDRRSLQNKDCVVEEAVLSCGGDEDDARLALSSLYAGVHGYAETYGRLPSEEQLACMGANMEFFAGYNKNKSVLPEVREAVDVMATASKDVHVVPQFMTLATLFPLLQISYNFCHSLGSVGHDELVVYELLEQAGPNPYGVPVGTPIDGDFDGGLANLRVMYDVTGSRSTTGTPVASTSYNLSKPYPAVKSDVQVYVNKMQVAEDDGSGNLTLVNGGIYNSDEDKVVIMSSSVKYWESDQVEVTLEVQGEIPDTMPVWIRVSTDTENYPDFVSQTQYRTRSLKLTCENDHLQTGLSLQAILKAMRNLKMNVKDIAFSRLAMIAASDGDRKNLRNLAMFAEGEREFSLALTDYRHPYEQWGRIREAMNSLSYEMQTRTQGKAGVKAWIGGKKFRLLCKNMSGHGVELADTMRNPSLATQPHFIGKFEEYDLFFTPNYPSDPTSEGVIGAGMGLNISASPAVLGTVTPHMLIRHGKQLDLADRASLFGQFYRDNPPEAFKYVTKLKLTNIPQ